MCQVLLRDLQATDSENWYNFLTEKLAFPFAARLGDRPIEVQALDAVPDDQFGLCVTIEGQSDDDILPLSELQPIADQRTKTILRDYAAWCAIAHNPDFFN